MSEVKERIAATALIVMFAGTIAGSGLAGRAAGEDAGYRNGQIDALNNKWLYQRVDAADGTTQYIKLEKAVTR